MMLSNWSNKDKQSEYNIILMEGMVYDTRLNKGQSS